MYINFLKNSDPAKDQTFQALGDKFWEHSVAFRLPDDTTTISHRDISPYGSATSDLVDQTAILARDELPGIVREKLPGIVRSEWQRPGRNDAVASMWAENMERLLQLVDHLQVIAHNAPSGSRSRLLTEVAALRAAHKREQERFSAFLQLTQEYADRYLRDIADEVQSQRSLLDMLEARLSMAKQLRTEAVELQKAFDDGSFKGFQKVKRAAGAVPLPDDTELFETVDSLLREIRACYRELDKFWIQEVGRVTKALKNCKVDKEDADRWEELQWQLKRSVARNDE
ncbi:hypothetical protein FA95DRAFT_1577526, partial [Auriscalpium vulgare]